MPKGSARIEVTAEGRRQIAAEFIKLINLRLRYKLPLIQREFVGAVMDGIRVYPEVLGLLDGGVSSDLDAELGTNDIAATISHMFAVMETQSRITFVPFKPPGASFLGAKLPSSFASGGTGNIDGTFRFEMIDGDFDEVINLPNAKYVSAPSKQIIPWLRWLLLEGFKTIDNWSITFDLTDQEEIKSRTKKALMKRKSGEHWVVPEPFRGDNIDHNFVIRAVASLNLETIFTNILKRHIG